MFGLKRLFGSSKPKQQGIWVECAECHTQAFIPGNDFNNIPCEQCNSNGYARLEMGTVEPDWFKGTE